MANILLVEDNTDMRLLIQEVLEWGGHQVNSGRCGTEGLDILASASPQPELIISDMMMPGMDGITFFQQVRNHTEWSAIRFIMMSANPYDDRLEKMSQSGLDGILPKPFSLEDLDAILR
ncbi:MAG TPA: response regulator [Phototrophicaceae bacterium]|nr:response regulator [Phototrophicaceae bacterium]